MKRLLVFCLLGALGAGACSRSEPSKERIKITQPAPGKGKGAESWDIAFDAWASDADRDLVRDVRKTLVGEGETAPFAEAIAIQINAGVVILHGSGAYTLNMEEWQTVGRLVKSVKGVRTVEIVAAV